jgi:O-methyltransferase domain
VTIRIRSRILNARLAAGAVSGGGVDQAYDGWREVSQFEFQQWVERRKVAVKPSISTMRAKSGPPRISARGESYAQLEVGRAMRMLVRKGTLLIAEAMSGVRGAESLDAYYGFYTLAMDRGEPRTVAEIGRLLRQAGFGRFRLLRNRMPIRAAGLGARPAKVRGPRHRHGHERSG